MGNGWPSVNAVAVDGGTMTLTNHCDKGEPAVSQTVDFGTMGKDYTISCPCGYKRRYPWMHQYVAIEKWNDEMEKVTP